MKVIDFIREYDEAEKSGLDDEIIRKHMNDEYVLFEDKVDAAKAIVDACYWNTEEDDFGNSRSVLNINSILKYYLTHMVILELFTDLERSFDGKQMLDDFNELNRRGIFKKIKQYINPDELSEFNTILQMICDDVIANEYENHAFVRKQVTRISDLFINVLRPVLEELDYEKIKNDLINSINGQSKK